MNQPLSSASKSEEAREASSTKGDHELVQRVQAGDSAAFRTLFEKYHRRAFAVAMGVLKNQDDALDAVQEAFVKVHKNIHKFQGSSSFYTWLYRIVMNVSIDHVRRTSRRKSLDFDERALHEESEVAGDGALVPSVTDANPGNVAFEKPRQDPHRIRVGQDQKRPVPPPEKQVHIAGKRTEILYGVVDPHDPSVKRRHG